VPGHRGYYCLIPPHENSLPTNTCRVEAATERGARTSRPAAPTQNGASDQTLDVALVVPLQGPAGVFGPSCELCAQLAAEEVNADGGILARELRFVVVDGGRRPVEVAADVDRLLTDGAVEAVTGWHISAVRNAVAPRIAGRAPYVYTPLYEGGEHRPGVFLTGETPDRQVRPALRWLRAECGARCWAVVGDDYVWPRQTARITRRYAAALGAENRPRDIRAARDHRVHHDPPRDRGQRL